MRVHPTDPRCFLVEVSDLQQALLPEPLREHEEPLRCIRTWAEEYLCRRHPELGRSGPVCPFTGPSLRKALFYLTVYRGAVLDPAEVDDVVRRYRDWFLELEPRFGPEAAYKTVGIIFPDLPAESYVTLIEETQARLKSDYVAAGLMIGEFHPGPPRQGGLRNPDFRPLRSPLPLLSIRHMVPTDFAFLHSRREWIESYLARFAGQVPTPIALEVSRVAASHGFPPLI